MNTEARLPRPGRSPKTEPGPHAIRHLVAEHIELQEMFTAFLNTRSVNNKRFLVRRICSTVSVHAQVQEELFYPAIAQLMPTFRPEHGPMKALVHHIQSLEPLAELVDDPILRLAEQVKMHVSTSHEEMFPRVTRSNIDLVELGDRMARRKAELVAQQD